MKTGIAGCGRMGLPMGLALTAGGIDTVGFDIKRANDFGNLPMEFSIEPFAHDLTVLFSVVRDEEQTNALLFDEQNVIKYADALEYLVICSTLSPKYVLDLRNRLPQHIHLVDAPMSGASIAAKCSTTLWRLRQQLRHGQRLTGALITGSPTKNS